MKILILLAALAVAAPAFACPGHDEDQSSAPQTEESASQTENGGN